MAMAASARVVQVNHDSIAAAHAARTEGMRQPVCLFIDLTIAETALLADQGHLIGRAFRALLKKRLYQHRWDPRLLPAYAARNH